VFALISVRPALIRAEWFTDLYLGAAITDDSEVKVDRYFPRQSASERTSYDTSFTFGGRIGYWLDVFHYLGFAADLSYFEADSEKVDFSIIPHSILFMLRWPLLISDDYPHGKIQPYLGGGPKFRKKCPIGVSRTDGTFGRVFFGSSTETSAYSGSIAIPITK
jgi:hypothetical protein